LLFCALKYKIFDRNGVVPELAMYTTGLENLLINCFFFGGGGKLLYSTLWDIFQKNIVHSELSNSAGSFSASPLET
jgi:hypothetical protein